MPNKTGLDPQRVSIAWQEPAMVQIGKNGLSEGLYAEAKRLLKKHKYIKVRVLRSALSQGQDKETLLRTLCLSIGAQLVGVRGNTAVVYKR
ncbi:MAG: YhbY family RNA-binding protein [Candidatus Hodarchaeota archaeon]